MLKLIYTTLSIVVTVSFLSGCATFKAETARHDQTESFKNRLDSLSEKYLNAPLSLQDAISIAMTNNYTVRKADLDTELSRTGKDVAFSSFLPSVSAAVGYNSYQRNPIVSSKKFETAQVDIGMPIFMPSTWFLFAATKHGYAAGKISAHYTRQSIALQTSDNYCNILVQHALIKAMEVQLSAAKENAERVKGLTKEGLAASWEGEQAVYAADAREMQLNQARRNLAVLNAKFLSGLGLNPGEHFILSGAVETKSPTIEISDTSNVNELVIKAIETHPLLLISDRQVVVKEHNVRQAICNFIPTLSIVGEQTWTGNKVMSVSRNWLTAFSGTWKVFDGFANVARYKASKVELEQSKLERENTLLSVIVNVTAAEATWRDAREFAKINKSAFDVAKLKSIDYDAKSSEGLITLGDALDARAAMDLAEVEFIKSRYQELTAKMALEFATGAIAY